MRGSFARFLAVLAGLVALAAALSVAGRMLLPRRDLSFGDPARGREVFRGRGRCSGCHALGDDGGVRGPDLAGVAMRARARVDGADAAAYLVQSLHEPDAYVVEGYPAGLMPAADLPPIALDADDVAAVVAFLLGEGAPVDPATLAAIGAAQVKYAGRPRGVREVASGDAVRGREVWARMGCGSCHALAGVEPAREGKAIGPDLSGIGGYQGEAYLRQAIAEPDAVVVGGATGGYAAEDGRHSRMPSYREVMGEGEREDLVALLVASR